MATVRPTTVCRLCQRKFSAYVPPFVGLCGHSLCKECSEDREWTPCPFCPYHGLTCWNNPTYNVDLLDLIMEAEDRFHKNATTSTIRKTVAKLRKERKADDSVVPDTDKDDD